MFGCDDTACGAHAQYLTIREDASLARILANLTFAQAAPATEGSHYALANITKAKIRAGQRVLVNGATGAIGSAAVQLLASRGVHVTAVCDTAHLELVRGLGAERVIDRTAEDLTQDGQTYDVVFDAVGKSSFGRCRRLLEPCGQLFRSRFASVRLVRVRDDSTRGENSRHSRRACGLGCGVSGPDLSQRLCAEPAGRWAGGAVPRAGGPIPSPAVINWIGDGFRRAVRSFADADSIPVVKFAKGAGRSQC